MEQLGKKYRPKDNAADPNISPTTKKMGALRKIKAKATGEDEVLMTSLNNAPKETQRPVVKKNTKTKKCLRQRPASEKNS